MTQVLKIVGRLRGRALQIRSSRLVSRAQGLPQPPESPLVAHVFDAHDRELSASPIALLPYCDGRGPLDAQAIRALIAAPHGATSFRFYLDGELIHRIDAGASPPEADLDWAASLSGAGPLHRALRLRWAPRRPTLQPLRSFYELSIDGGQTWRRITPTLDGVEHEIDLSRLPGGAACQLALVTTDGVQVHRNLSPVVSLPVRPCLPLVLNPADGAAFVAGTPVELVGQGWYHEERQPELEHLDWASSLDGPLGRGRFVTTRALRPGLHEITLTAGQGDRTSSATVSITVA